MHGEFKVPGGKLVVVDLEVVDGVIHDFSLAGDFFLEPDTALADINAAVNGLPADSDAKRMTEVIQSALPKDAVLLGFSPESVATTIRRALSSATSFTDYKWEVIHGQSERPQLQMALDQVLAEEVGEGVRRHVGVGTPGEQLLPLLGDHHRGGAGEAASGAHRRASQYRIHGQRYPFVRDAPTLPAHAQIPASAWSRATRRALTPTRQGRARGV